MKSTESGSALEPLRAYQMDVLGDVRSTFPEQALDSKKACGLRQETTHECNFYLQTQSDQVQLPWPRLRNRVGGRTPESRQLDRIVVGSRVSGDLSHKSRADTTVCFECHVLALLLLGPRTMSKRLARLTVIVCVAIWSITAAEAATIQLQWDPSPDGLAQGYLVNYGTQSGSYTASINVGNVRTFTVTDLVPGVRYYFTVQAYAGSLLSAQSQEVSWIPSIAATTTLRNSVDLDGDDLADLFVINRATGDWSVQLSTGTGQFNAGGKSRWILGWDVYPADFNGDGRSDFLLYNPTNGLWYKAISAPGDTFYYFAGAWAAGWTPSILDLNGDGRSDVFVYNRKSGIWYKAISVGDGMGAFTYEGGAWAPDWEVYAADFDGNSQGDLFLYSRARGTWYKALNSGGIGFTYYSGAWAPNWNITILDLNRDGRTDAFLYNSTTGVWYQAVSTSTAFWYTGGLWAVGWTISSADWDADGRDDLFLYNSKSGVWYKVLNDGTLFSYFSGVWALWSTYITDLNGDGRSDVFLYNPQTGTWYQALTTTTGAFGYATGTWQSGLEPITTR
jgi:hypothetical protein